MSQEVDRSETERFQRRRGEIRRIMSSDPDIETVFNRFSDLVGSLVEFDRIDINLVDVGENTITPLYGQARGVHVEMWEVGRTVTLSVFPEGEVATTEDGLFFNLTGHDDLIARFPRVEAAYRAGIRSVVAAPLRSLDRIFGF